MSLLKKEIEKLEGLVENAKTEKEKASYGFDMASLKYMLAQVDHQYDDSIDNEMYDLLCNISKNRMLSIHNQIIQPEYIYFINKLTKNCLKQFKYADLEEQHFEKIYTLKDTKELLIDFYNSFNPYLYKTIKKSLNSDHLHIIRNTDKNDINVYCNSQSGNCHITMYHNGKFSISDIGDLAHELGHVVNMTMLKDNNQTGIGKLHYCNFSEASAMILEMIFHNYLIKNNINKIEAYKNLSRDLRILQEEIHDLTYVNEMAMELPLMLPYQKLDDESIKDLNEAYKKYSYSYGYLLAFYYLNKYEQDQERTKRNIMNFINAVTTMSDFEMLSHFDINIDSFMKCGYLKKPIKDCQKILK